MRLATLQGAGTLLGQAEVLLAQPLQRLVLGDLHARAHVAVAVHEEGESAGQVFAALAEGDERQKEEVWNVKGEFRLFHHHHHRPRTRPDPPPPSINRLTLKSAPRSKWEPLQARKAISGLSIIVSAALRGGRQLCRK